MGGKQNFKHSLQIDASNPNYRPIAATSSASPAVPVASSSVYDPRFDAFPGNKFDIIQEIIACLMFLRNCSINDLQTCQIRQTQFLGRSIFSLKKKTFLVKTWIRKIFNINQPIALSPREQNWQNSLNKSHLFQWKVVYIHLSLSNLNVKGIEFLYLRRFELKSFKNIEVRIYKILEVIKHSLCERTKVQV